MRAYLLIEMPLSSPPLILIIQAFPLYFLKTHSDELLCIYILAIIYKNVFGSKLKSINSFPLQKIQMLSGESLYNSFLRSNPFKVGFSSPTSNIFFFLEYPVNDSDYSASLISPFPHSIYCNLKFSYSLINCLLY